MSGAQTQVINKTTIRSQPRIDGIERVTGDAKYGGDWKVPGMLYGRVVLSNIAHGVVKKIDSESVLSMDGLKALITCFDDNTIWHAGDSRHERRVFTPTVRFAGDCIAAIAATDRKIAQEAVGLLQVEYEELPAVCSIDKARSADAPKIWEDGNVVGPLSYGFGNLDSAFNNGQILERDYRTSRIHIASLEPAGSLAWWAGDKLTVVAGTQGIYGCREGLAHDLGIPQENVRVITHYKGGGFGDKDNVMNYDLVACLLARKAGRPVMLEYSRMEDFLGMHSRWPSVQHLRGAVSREDGRLLGVDLRAICDLGAYTRVMQGHALIYGTETCYASPAWRGEVYGVYTNTPTTGGMRAPRGPQSCFAGESFIDELAHELKINPYEFRLRNAAVRFHGEEDFTSNGLRECLAQGSEAIGWKERWHPPPPQPGRKGMAKGLGVAIAAWGSRLGKGEAKVRIQADGEVIVSTGVVDIGTGAKTTMAVTAAKELGIRAEKIKLLWGDTDLGIFSIGETGSRVTVWTGTAVREASCRVKQKLLSLASGMLGTPIENLDVTDGQIYRKDGGGLSFGAILSRAGLDAVEETVQTQPTLPEHTQRYSFAAHFAEVEIDTETGQVHVTDYVAAHDSSSIVNRLTAESQVQGGVIMGLGMAMSESLMIDEEVGSTQNPSLITYRIPDHSVVPRIRTIFVETEDRFGPKSLGEIPTVPVPAVIGNAIFNATGVRLRSLPMTPESLLRASGSL